MSWRSIAIDECADVDACEYVKLPVGGVMWESPAIPVPIDAGDDTEFPDLPWVKAALSGGWWSVIYGYADVTWIRFDPRLADQLRKQQLGDGFGR